MIKLLDLLKEVKAIPTPEEQKVIDDILGLDEGAVGDAIAKAKRYAKKGLLTATVLTALLASPQLSKAEGIEITNLAKAATSQQMDSSTTTHKDDRIGTDVDGINGEFTSQFIFPTAFLKNLNTGKLTNLGVEGNKALAIINSTGISAKQMGEWNAFVKWMKSKGYSANKKMNNIAFSNKALEEYRAENPDFWIKSGTDIEKIQSNIKAYRLYVIGEWRIGKGDIEIGTKTLKPGVDDKDLDRFMSWAR
jgi:hypothetical protein